MSNPVAGQDQTLALFQRIAVPLLSAGIAFAILFGVDILAFGAAPADAALGLTQTLGVIVAALTGIRLLRAALRRRQASSCEAQRQRRTAYFPPLLRNRSQKTPHQPARQRS